MNKIILFLFLLKGSFVVANEPFLLSNDSVLNSQLRTIEIPKWKRKIITKVVEQKNEKLVAITFATLLGSFGVHRLYLGTKTRVPVIYAITLGGIFVLPVTDIIAIITTKDIDKFKNNGKIIMWIN